MTPSLVAVTTVLVVVLVLNQHRATPSTDRIVKMAASTGFIAVALSVGATTSAYGRLVLAALALSWLGDLILTFSAVRAFRAGLAAFLAAHLAYTAGFVTRGIEVTWLVVSGVALIAIAAWVWRWLAPHVDDARRRPVMVYVAVITSMVAAAVGTTAAVPDARIAIGAVLFYVSDLAVARNRFVAPGTVNQAMGRPMYYAGQVLLALSAGG